MKGYQNTNINHVNLNSLLSSGNSNDILKMFSEQYLPLEKSHSDDTIKEDILEDNMTPSELILSKSKSFKNTSKKDQNFKVVIRVRPPLPREIDSLAGFLPITNISKNNK